jgi:hypothetical protein
MEVRGHIASSSQGIDTLIGAFWPWPMLTLVWFAQGEVPCRQWGGVGMGIFLYFMYYFWAMFFMVGWSVIVVGLE